MMVAQMYHSIEKSQAVELWLLALLEQSQQIRPTWEMRCVGGIPISSDVSPACLSGWDT